MKSYLVCGYSAVGKSHTDKNIPCQDNCYYESNDNIVVAAIADGLSSSKHSDIASKIAVEFVVNKCLKNIAKQDSEDKIITTIRESFDGALFAIKKIAREAENDLNDYDTTLTVAVLIEEILYYGQIGDSGIVALLEDGRFERVTEAQNGEGIGKDRPVYPLAAVSKWTFKKYDHKVKALFLATDGVLKNIQHPLLEGQQYNLNHKYLAYIYTKLNLLKDDEVAKECIKDEVEKLTPEEVDYDDKTLVVVINKKCNLKPQSSDYYNFPTDELWKNIQKKYETELYPYRSVEKKEPTVQKDKHENNNPDAKYYGIKPSVQIKESDLKTEITKVIKKTDGKLSENSQKNLANQNKSLMKPVSNSGLRRVKPKSKEVKNKDNLIDVIILICVIIIMILLFPFIVYILLHPIF